MANYNLTDQTISSSFQQLLQKDTDTGNLVDGLGNPIDSLTISGSTTSDFFIGDGSQLTNIPHTEIPQGTVSGSSQIDYPEISNIPSGIVSGSSQVNLTDTTFVDGTEFQVLRTDGAGNLSFDYADRAQIEIRTDEAIVKGDPLYVTGFSDGENRVTVGKADASDPSKMPAYGVAYESVSQNTNTQMVAIGSLDDVNTQVAPHDFQVGDTLYVAAGGGLTNVKPTGTNLIQNVGIVGRRNQNNGEILVSAIGRSNDIPNIQEGYVWAGNASGVATAVSTGSFGSDIDTGSFATTGSNVFSGNQEFNTGSLTFVNMSGQTSINLNSSNIANGNQIFGNEITANGKFIGFAPAIGEGELIELNYPFTGSAGNDGRITQAFSDYGAGTQFDQNITGVDFSYFKATDGGMIFETIGNGEIKFFSANDTAFGPTGNFTSTKIMKQTVPALGNNSIADSIVITDLTGSNTIQYPLAHVGLQNYPGTNEQAFSVEYSNSAYTYYNALFVNPSSTKLELNTGVGYDYDNVEFKDNGDNTSTFAVKADNLELGKNTATSIEIGNGGTVNTFSGSHNFNGTFNQEGANFTVGGFTQFNDTVRLNNVPLEVTSSTDAALTKITKNEIITKDGNNVVQAQMQTAYGGTIGFYNISTGDNFGFTLQSENWGYPANWTGPGIHCNNPSDTYPTVIGFQSKATYTDGRVTVLTPLIVSSSVSITDTMNLAQQDPLPAGTTGDLAVSASNLYFHNGTSWGQIN
jgi:hypothetical protein